MRYEQKKKTSTETALETFGDVRFKQWQVCHGHPALPLFYIKAVDVGRILSIWDTSISTLTLHYEMRCFRTCRYTMASVLFTSNTNNG
jgi:hypothetical protein